MIKQIKTKIVMSILLFTGICSSFLPKQALSYTLISNNTEQTPLRSNQETLIASPYNLMSPYRYPVGNGGNAVQVYDQYPSGNMDDSWNRGSPRNRNEHRRRVDRSYPYRGENPRYRKDYFNCTTITQGVSNSSGFVTIRHQFCH